MIKKLNSKCVCAQVEKLHADRIHLAYKKKCVNNCKKLFFGVIDINHKESMLFSFIFWGPLLLIFSFFSLIKIRNIGKHFKFRKPSLIEKIAELDASVKEISKDISTIKAEQSLELEQGDYFIKVGRELKSDVERLQEFGKQYRKNLSPEDKEIYDKFKKLLDEWLEHQANVEADISSLNKRKKSMLDNLMKSKQP